MGELRAHDSVEKVEAGESLSASCFMLWASFMEMEPVGLRRQADVCSPESWGSFSKTLTVGWGGTAFSAPSAGHGVHTLSLTSGAALTPSDPGHI